MLMEGYEIRSPEKYKNKIAMFDGPQYSIRDSEDTFIGMGRAVTVLEDTVFRGYNRPDSPAYSCLILRPDNFTEENWTERQLKGRRHLLVPIKDIEFEPRGSAPRKLLCRKEELQKCEEVRI